MLVRTKRKNDQRVTGHVKLFSCCIFSNMFRMPAVKQCSSEQTEMQKIRNTESAQGRAWKNMWVGSFAEIHKNTDLCRSNEKGALEMPCRQKWLPISVVLQTLASRNVCQLVLKYGRSFALNNMGAQGIVNLHKMKKRAAIQIRMP